MHCFNARKAFSALVGGAILSLASVPLANATTIPLSLTYDSHSSQSDLINFPDFYIKSLTFTLPANFTNASLNITALSFDDRGAVQLNGTTVTSSGITNGHGLNGQMQFTAGGAAVPWTFQYGSDLLNTFTPITSGFQAGLNTVDLIVNDTSGGLNFREGLLSGGWFWYTIQCFDNSGCPFTEVRNGITYFRGNPDPHTGAVFEASVTFDQAAVSETPLPAALPLFAGGLGVMGLIARRRKQRLATH